MLLLIGIGERLPGFFCGFGLGAWSSPVLCFSSELFRDSYLFVSLVGDT